MKSESKREIEKEKEEETPQLEVEVEVEERVLKYLRNSYLLPLETLGPDYMSRDRYVFAYYHTLQRDFRTALQSSLRKVRIFISGPIDSRARKESDSTKQSRKGSGNRINGVIVPDKELNLILNASCKLSLSQFKQFMTDVYTNFNFPEDYANPSISRTWRWSEIELGTGNTPTETLGPTKKSEPSLAYESSDYDSDPESEPESDIDADPDEMGPEEDEGSENFEEGPGNYEDEAEIEGGSKNDEYGSETMESLSPVISVERERESDKERERERERVCVKRIL